VSGLKALVCCSISHLANSPREERPHEDSGDCGGTAHVYPALWCWALPGHFEFAAAAMCLLERRHIEEKIVGARVVALLTAVRQRPARANPWGVA
jgi:hypothetical protein